MLLRTFDFRHNAIGFLRLFFASIVILGHAYRLGGLGPDPLEQWSRGTDNIGYLAVGCFFVLSGFLIARSAEHVGSFPRFLWHRFVRIFPAFWVCLAVTAFVLAPLTALLEHRPVAAVFTAHAEPVWRYLVVNADLSMRQYGIANLLDGRPVPDAFDGSLWTLRFEFACYLLLGAFAVLGVLTRRRRVLAAFAILLYLVYAVPIAFHGLLPPQLSFPALLHGVNRHGAELFVTFFAGAAAYAYRDRIPLTRAAGIVAVVVLAASFPFQAYAIVYAPALTAATLWLAAELPLRDVDRRVDLSYGIYIYAFPLQQLLGVAGVPAAGYALYVLSAYAATLVLACGSWFLIERNALRYKDIPAPAAWTRLVARRART